MRSTRLLLFLTALAVLAPGLYAQASPTSQAAWAAIGPDGGDARRFAFDSHDPRHIYLGTTDSWIYQSADGGSSWSRLARLSTQDNLVVDSLVVDRSNPRTLFAGVWVMDHPDGGIYISHDGGRSWAESRGMTGQSVLALAQARSNPNELVAGTLRGVYRSLDKGLHWRQISPPGSAEIHEVESIAIDPYDAGIIYAGTWHLPWKTMDGGATWRSMKQGLIVDSDIFSMIVDPSRPSVVYLSACSGIYRSDDFGDDFRKVQGIPSSARRTRVITMDPSDRNIVYAGTTEGLYKTRDGGKNWTRTTGSQVIVNDVYIDPRNPQHVLLATDRGGVLASEDGGITFEASNTGFSQRQVAALLVDAKDPGTLYAGVINDKTYGGVFVTTDFGRSWRQQSAGLDGRDVFMLAQGADGALLAGTSDGVFRWSGSAWAPSNSVGLLNAAAAPPAPRTRRNVHGRREERHSTRRTDDPSLQGRVTALAVSEGTWFAATTQGVFRSTNDGQSWQGPVLGDSDAGVFSGAGNYVAITSFDSTVYAARRNGIVMSVDGGVRWEPVIFPSGLTAIEVLAASPDGTLWAGGREGLFFTTDRGRTWTKLSHLPLVAINSLVWDPSMKRVIVTSRESTVIFAIDPRDRTWKWWNAGWNVHSVAWSGGRLMAASLFSGIVAQPPLETAAAGGGMAQNAQR
ncbi:MAG TPA: hypothetical protein VMD25_09815 [Acidobacteriaceae bacterium]|nr:hypothetical protein [Acidobacteriaceae bacterium]